MARKQIQRTLKQKHKTPKLSQSGRQTDWESFYIYTVHKVEICETQCSHVLVLAAIIKKKKNERIGISRKVWTHGEG